MTTYIVEPGSFVLIVSKAGRNWEYSSYYETQRAFGFESKWLVDENARIPEGFKGKVFLHAMLGHVFVYDGSLIATELTCAEWRLKHGLDSIPSVSMS